MIIKISRDNIGGLFYIQFTKPHGIVDSTSDEEGLLVADVKGVVLVGIEILSGTASINECFNQRSLNIVPNSSKQNITIVFNKNISENIVEKKLYLQNNKYLYSFYSQNELVKLVLPFEIEAFKNENEEITIEWDDRIN